MSDETAAPVPGPAISVIVRTKDRPRLLAEAVQSLGAQTYRDFEVVLVNDSDTPPDASLLADPPGLGLRVVTPGPPHGRSRALNAGAAAAKGRWLAYLDDDDLYLPDHLGALAEALAGPGAPRAVYSDCDVVRMTRDAEGSWREVSRTPGFGRQLEPWRLAFSNFVPLVCLVHERALWEEVGRYDESFDLYEDWEFLIRVSRRTSFLHVPRTTALYRLRDDASNATLATPWRSPTSETARLAVYRRHWDLHTPETEAALVDAFDDELGAALGREQGALRLLDEARVEVRHLESRLAEASAEHAHRAEQLARARDAVAVFVGERDALAAEVSRLAAERDRLDATVTRMTNSLAWRLFTPWWKLRVLLERRRRDGPA